MFDTIKNKPELVVKYVDPIEGFKGWLVIDRFDHELCAGGLRVQKGLTRKCVEQLAGTMTLKMRIAGIRVDGAKSGIDYDPNSPGKQEALYRFVRAIQPFICCRYSVGPDMNTTMKELDSIVARLDLPSIKIAIAKVQGLDRDDFIQRTNTLLQPAGHTVLGRLRSGFGLCSACLGGLEHLEIACSQATVAIQGFGGLASGAAYCLNQAGVKVVAVADKEKSIIGSAKHPLNLSFLLQHSSGGLIPNGLPEGRYGDRDEIYNVPCDVFVPAAIEKAITRRVAEELQVKAVVCGANLAVTPMAEKVLYRRDILLVPDLVAGCGGSLSMEGLFGPTMNPTVQQVLQFVDIKMRNIVRKILERSQLDSISTREASLRLCSERPVYPGTRPYGPLPVHRESQRFSSTGSDLRFALQG